MGNDSLQQVLVTRIPRRESNQRKFGMRGGGGEGEWEVQEPPMLLNPKCFTITKACLILLLHLIGREGACGFYRPITELSKKK